MLLPIEIIEEAEKVERELDPAFSLTLVQSICVHDGGGVIQSRSWHHWSLHISRIHWLINYYLYHYNIGWCPSCCGPFCRCINFDFLFLVYLHFFFNQFLCHKYYTSYFCKIGEKMFQIMWQKCLVIPLPRLASVAKRQPSNS